jgi:hypothetical protein
LSILLSILNGFSWRHGFEVFPNVFFGSLSGTFLLAYVILWMVLPEAHSTYEKMEMRGEKVDVNTIRQSVQEGMGNVKDRMKTWGEEVKTSAQNLGSKAKEFADTRGKVFAREVNETARRSGRGIGHAIGVLFKVFFLFIAGSIAFGLFVAVMALIFGGVAWWPINDFLWTSKWQQAFAWGTLIFFLLVPVLALIVWIVRRIIHVRSRKSYLGWTFGFLWLIGWICAVSLAASISKDFRAYDNVSTEITTAQPANNKMIVVVSEPELKYTGSFNWIDDDAGGWDLSGDTARLSTVRFHVIKSADSAYHVVLRKYSYGRTTAEAQNRADRIQYHITSTDSVLDLGNGYTVDKQSKFRGQQAEIEIQVPVGKKLRFDASVPEKLNPANFKLKRSYRHRRVFGSRRIIEYNYDENNFPFRTDIDYVMGIDGELKLPDGTSVDKDYHYNIQPSVIPADSIEIDKSIEQKKKEIKELEEKKKEQSRQQPHAFNKKLSSHENTVAITHSAIFSLVDMMN